MCISSQVLIRFRLELYPKPVIRSYERLTGVPKNSARTSTLSGQHPVLDKGHERLGIFYRIPVSGSGTSALLMLA